MLSDEMESRKSGDFKFQTGAKNFPTILETRNPNGEEKGLVEFEVEYLLFSLSPFPGGGGANCMDPLLLPLPSFLPLLHSPPGRLSARVSRPHTLFSLGRTQ